ncbi:MAG: hypothetical protein HPY69_05985 [Armatimonadetes bacterium]|nr:hypothetical protein [Armatimonadota bacterium]
MYRTVLLVLALSVVITLLATAVYAQTFYFRFGGGGLQRYLYGPSYYGNPDIGYYYYRGFSHDPYLWSDWERRGVYGWYWDGRRYVEGWYSVPQPYGRYYGPPYYAQRHHYGYGGWEDDRREQRRDRDNDRDRDRGRARDRYERYRDRR